MKTIILLVALVFQGLLTQATTINIRTNSATPNAGTVTEGILFPLLAVDVKATEKQFPPPVMLVIQQKGVSTFHDSNPIKEIYIGDPERLIGWGPFLLDNYNPTIVGPIFLTEDEWRTVVISAHFSPDLSPLNGKEVGIEVVGIAVDGYSTEQSDVVNFVGNFPLKSSFHIIDTNTQAETLTIRNTTTETEINSGPDIQTLATFDFVAENGNVLVSDLPLLISLTEGPAQNITNISLVNQDGVILTGIGNYMVMEHKNGHAIYFRDLDLIIPQGTNHWTINGSVLSTNLPDTSTLKVGIRYFGEAEGTGTGYKIIPIIQNENQGITVLNASEFTGTFIRNLTLGSTGDDVLMLQRILNTSPDTQVATEGLGSPGNETRHYDQSTKFAVMKFQEKYGIPATGFVGPLTRGLLNSRNMAQHLEARIDRIIFYDDQGSISLHGSLKLDTSYNLEGSIDLVNWENLGRIEGNAYGVLKEPIGRPMVVNPKYKDRAFFRLREVP